ncbi:MAG TPA: hypothetical protein VMZ91_13195 [Candidatus Paceibacterota bacterium]|nr:hypothetical protein [Candidatus Paceibacterota bacterium]
MKKIEKKPVKAKKKTVKSKKKKIVKTTSRKKVVNKKTTKKKTVKKKIAKKVIKKRKKRKRISMEDIYSIINKVQFGKKKIIFTTDLTEAPTIENNIKDAELKYNKVEMKTQVVFTLYPNKNSPEEDILRLEVMDDEIPDIDQIFG